MELEPKCHLSMNNLVCTVEIRPKLRFFKLILFCNGAIMSTNVRSGEVVGVKVKNNTLEDLGEIAEIVIDKSTGRVSYLVLDFGGFMSFGNKFFAVPWQSFTYNPDEDCFILNIAKERLKDAPGFDKNHWPDFVVPEVIKTISDFYG